MGFENHEDDGEILDAAKMLFRKNSVFPGLKELYPDTIDTKFKRRQTEKHLDKMRNFFNASEKYYIREDMVKQATYEIMKTCLVDFDDAKDIDTYRFNANGILEDAVDTLGQFQWGQHMPYGNMFFELPVAPMDFLLRSLWQHAYKEWEDYPQFTEQPNLEQIHRIGSFCSGDGYRIEKVGVLVIRDMPFYYLDKEGGTQRGISYYFVARVTDKLVAPATNDFPYPKPYKWYVPEWGITFAPNINKNSDFMKMSESEFEACRIEEKASHHQHALFGFPVKQKSISKKGFVLAEKTFTQSSVTFTVQSDINNQFKDNFFGITIAVVNKLLAQLNFSRLVEYQHSTSSQKSSSKRKKRGTVVTQPSDETRYKTIYLPKDSSSVVRPSEKKDSNAHNRKAFKVDGHTRCYPTDVTNCKRDHSPNNPRYVKCGWCKKHQRYCHTIFVKDQVRGNPKLGWVHREREVRHDEAAS